MMYLCSRIYFERPMLQWTLGFLHHIQPAVLDITDLSTSGLAEALRHMHIPTLTSFAYECSNKSKFLPLVLDPLVLFLSRHAPRLAYLRLRLPPSQLLPGSFSEAISRRFSANTHEPWFPRVTRSSTVHAMDFRLLKTLVGDAQSVGWVLTAALNALISVPELSTTPTSLSAEAPPDELDIHVWRSKETLYDDFCQHANEALTALALVAILGQGPNPLAWPKYKLELSQGLLDDGTKWKNGEATPVSSKSPLRCRALGASIHRLALWGPYIGFTDDVAALPQVLGLLPNLEFLALFHLSRDHLNAQTKEFWEGVRRSCPALGEVLADPGSGQSCDVNITPN